MLRALAVMLATAVLTGCSGEGQDTAPDTYSGPRLPGLAAAPAWGGSVKAFASDEDDVYEPKEVYALNDSFALVYDVSGKDSDEIAFVNAKNGKLLARRDVPSGAGMDVDNDHGRAVLVVRKGEEVQATGLTGGGRRVRHWVFDDQGKQVFSLTTQREYYRGGFVFRGRKTTTSEVEEFTDIRDTAGRVLATLPPPPPEAGRWPRISEIVGNIVIFDDDRAVDLANGGRVAWTRDKIAPAGTEPATGDLVGVAGGRVLFEWSAKDKGGQQALSIHDSITGQGVVTRLDGVGVGLGRVSYDVDHRAVLVHVGAEKGPEQMAAFDVNSGRPLWLQPGDNPRALSYVASFGGLTYTVDGSTNPKRDDAKFVVINSSTGQLVADNLSSGPIVISRDHALVRQKDRFFGFAIKRPQ